MHLQDEYSLATALKIDKIQIRDQFFPVPFNEPFIVVNTGTGMPAKNYSHYKIVMNKLFPELKKKGFKVIQIGGKDEERVVADLDLCGQTTLPQFFNLIGRASLLLSGDTASMHAAGALSVPLVALFGPTHPKISGPREGDKTKQIILTAPDFKPSFNPNEFPRSIDLIEPEEVVKAVSRLLDIEFSAFETLHIGGNFRALCVESVPNAIVSPNFLNGQILNIRYDKGGEENAVYEQLKYRKCVVITDKPLNIQFLTALRPNIEGIIYMVKEKDDVKFVEELHKAALPYRLLSFLSEEELNDKKLNYIDFNLIERHETRSSKMVRKADKLSAATKFQSNKRILSNGKFYLSYAHLEAEKSLENFEQSVDTIIDSPAFWEDVDYYHLFNENTQN